MKDRTLKIGGHTYQVKVVPTWPEGDEADSGETIYAKQIIYIKSTMPQTEQEQTLIHEILHVLNSTLNHTFLESLAEQFYQVLHDNHLKF